MRGNVAGLKAQWQTHMMVRESGPPFSGEAQPIVRDGVIYVSTGADDVFAIDAETGRQLWVYQAHLEKTISTVCCGWVSRGVAIGEGKIFLGRLDGAIVALDQHTGNKSGRCKRSVGRTASRSRARLSTTTE